MTESQYLYEIKPRKAGQPDMVDSPYEPMFIYVLVDPRTNSVRYIGTTNCPGVRFAQHRVKVVRRELASERDKWIADLQDAGLQPRMFVVDETCRKYAGESEVWYIRHFAALGCDLVNGRNHRGYRTRL